MQLQQSHREDLRILALETSGKSGSLALAVGSAEGLSAIDQVELPASQRTAQSLLTQLDALLKRHGWRPAEVGLVCVSTGPGSFTGLRIGITAAKTFAYATGAALVGVHTLLTLAEQAEAEQPVWTVLDAQREQLFAARHPSDWRSRSDYQFQTQVLDIEAWLEMLKPGEVVSGPPLHKLADKVSAAITIVDSSQWSPAAASVAKLGYQLFLQGKTTNPMQLVPSYYRKSAAEEKADRPPTHP